MKKIEYLCNVCRVEIKENKGYGMMWHGAYGKEELTIVRLHNSENHICFNCFSEINKVKIPESL